MMKYFKISCVCILILFLTVRIGYSYSDEIKSDSIKKISNYESKLDRPFVDRISDMPEMLLSYHMHYDKINNYKNYRPTKEERRIFEKYYNNLPEQFKAVMEKKVIAVYFCENFFGGGLTDFVLDENDEMYIVLLFNPKIFTMTLPEWIKFRDNSSFKEDKNGFVVNNTLPVQYKGALHTMTHEASHVYDYIVHATPYVEPAVKDDVFNAPKDFVENIWEDYSVPYGKYDFSMRKNIKTYGLRSLGVKNNMIPVIYSDLKKTPFASLYGTSIWVEDFAETFTWNYLYEKYSITYKVLIEQNGKVVESFSPIENIQNVKRYKNVKLIDYSDKISSEKKGGSMMGVGFFEMLIIMGIISFIVGLVLIIISARKLSSRMGMFVVSIILLFFGVVGVFVIVASYMMRVMK